MNSLKPSAGPIGIIELHSASVEKRLMDTKSSREPAFAVSQEKGMVAASEIHMTLKSVFHTQINAFTIRTRMKKIDAHRQLMHA